MESSVVAVFYDQQCVYHATVISSDGVSQGLLLHPPYFPLTIFPLSLSTL